MKNGVCVIDVNVNDLIDTGGPVLGGRGRASEGDERREKGQ